MAPTPGLLYVTMQPKPGLPIAQFHDWYNNEHGPTRLRLPFVENGFRYRATDLEGPGKAKPEWLAWYDITDMGELTKETYNRLRLPEVKSEREKGTMKQIAVDRRLYDLVSERKAEGYRKLEDVDASQGNVLVAVSNTIHPGKREELDKWLEEEHIPLLTKVPGWLRTRRFVTSYIDREGKDEEHQLEYLALYEYASENGLGGEELKAAVSTPWRNEVYESVVKGKSRRVYDLYYTFGAAPRDLESLSSSDAVSFTSPDGLTKGVPASSGARPAIESFVTTPDGVDLPFRLEGSADPNAPLIVLSNSVLVEWGIWDSFVDALLKEEQNKKYRILRYHTRGRSSIPSSKPVTVDLLASDIITLLDALRVPQAAAVVGVSLGGATVLNTALKYPKRVAAFVSCDTNANSPAGNKKAWGDRIAVAEKEGATARSGENIVGEELAEMTTRRWFVKESYDSGEMEKQCERVKQMVINNSLEGFKRGVEALFEYDLRDEMKTAKVKGIFLVGSGDGVLPDTMKEMSTSYGSGAEYVVIDGAGHLPMFEKPKEVAEVVTRFQAA